jgi:hypothetical protein
MQRWDVRPADVRFGSLADIATRWRHVRFTPESGHVQCNSACLLWAKSGHCEMAPEEKDRPTAVSSEIGRLRAPSDDYFDLVVDFVVVSSMSVFEPVVVLWPGA